MPGDFSFTGSVAPICEIGMSDTRQAEPSSWLDVSCYVHEAEVHRGRERFNDRFEPGTASITFDNRTGWGDLVGTAATVPDQTLRPGRQIRVGVSGPFDDGPVTTRWLFRGFIDQTVPAYDPVLHDIVTVNCIDAFGESGINALQPGPLVGVNESVQQRIHRVLDAASWWAPKRKIGPAATLVQGTTLAGQATDLMTQAADSDGGVVYGDLDGDVVFRNLDWALYDPALPHDGEIGNMAPGLPPSPGVLPYLDPTLGDPPYDPAPPPPTHPTTTHFCVGQNDPSDVMSGTIIERGEAYTLFVQKPGFLPEGTLYQPHLYLTENGQTWDLGEWPVEGGCTTITHPVEPPAGAPPGTPPGPPTRHDDPTPTNPDPPTIPGIPVPPEDLSLVELLGYSDGGLTDPPADTVTVTLTKPPGPDCLIVVLVCALRNDITAGGLTPFPSAGGSITATGDVVTFDEIAREPSGSSGAESYGAAGRTGRTDPGLFTVTVDWSGAEQSREHIVTVWGIHHDVPDLLDRMRLGDYLRSFTWDRTVTPFPSPNPPGKGFWQTAFENPATDTPPYARLQDITIAQSLAESPNPPYGATFNTVDGEWWTPVFADAPALLAAAAPAVVDGGWVDDFERADGPVGADWVAGLNVTTPTSQSETLFTINSGAAVSPEGVGTPSPVGSMLRAAPTPFPDQTVEVVVDNLWAAAEAAVIVFNLADPATGTAWAAQIIYSGGDTVSLEVLSFTAPGVIGEDHFIDYNVTASGPFTMRLESYATGRQVLSYNGTVVIDYAGTPVGAGTQQGVYCDWRGSQPRVLTISGGPATGVCDDFERADGPLGANWQIGPGPGWAQSVAPLTIVSGAAVGTATLSATSPYTSNSMSWATPAAPGVTQSVEITVENIWPGASGQYAALMTNQTPGAKTSQFADFQFSLTTPGNGDIVISAFHFDAAGDSSSPSGRAIVPRSTSEPVKLRLESDPDGTQRAYIDDALGLTWVDPAPVTGPLIGVSLDNRDGTTSPRILEACIGGAGAGGIVRKCSWVAGYRGPLTAPQTAPHDVKFAEVNTGPDNIQSCQASVVVEMVAADQFGWHTLAHYERAPALPTTLPPTSHSSTIRYGRNSIILIYVSAFAATDMASTINIAAASVGGLPFTAARIQGKTDPLSHAQGAVFWAKTPALAEPDPVTITVAWGAAVDGISYLIEEVTNGGTVAATASAVRGTHGAGSVDGGVVAALSAAPATSSLVLGFLGVLAEPNEVGAVAGAGWTEEIQVLPTAERTYLQAQSRVSSVDPNVAWTDMNASTLPAYDAVVLAVEVTPGPAYVNWETDGPLVIGGSGNAFNGPIYSAEDRDASGNIIWSFHPGDYV